MPGVARIGQDNAMGMIIGPGQPTVLVNGTPISVVGDLVTAHGAPPHTAAVIITGSGTVFAGGKPISIQGVSTCTCAHPVVTGSPTVQAT
jgi:uncharacterized Zn-binding protein involved in type VI secretion